MTLRSSSENLQEEMALTWQWRIDTDPELAAAMGLLSTRRSTHALDPRSLASFQQRLEWLRAALQRVHANVSRDDLRDEQEQLSYDIYVTQLSDYIRFTPWHKSYLCCLNRLEGPQTDLPLYARYLPTKTKEERAFYLKFLQAIPIQLGEVINLLQTGLVENRTPPKVSLDGVVPQVRGMINGNLEAFREPIRNAFPKDEAKILEACQAQIDGSVTQAFADFADFLQNEYIPHLREDISAVTGYPDGKQYYQDCLAFHTTTSMTPDEIHELGLSEVERVRQEMEAIAAQAGYGGRLDDYLEHLRTSKVYEAESGQALCSLFRDITGRIAPAMLKLFHLETLPRMPFSIVETPSAHASMAPAAYYLAGSTNQSASRPGIFYVNTSELPTRRTYECEALALHEAIPGHHTQGSIQGESHNLPAFRQMQEDRRYFEAPCRFPFYTGYIEGWGLHSETLGEELGLYTKPESKMGQLSMEALRSCRLVVDTGMHAMGWTLDEALHFMLENTAMGKHDAATEVARYVTWPGQATAYKVGERYLRKLRTMAETELAEKFDPRDFYDVVLQVGPVPLDTLEKLVRDYIQETSNRTASSGGDLSEGEPGFLEQMTFFNWCKCCVVPGSCQSTAR
jgi:uncharacterized protein (DUF885 family)